MRDLLLVCLLPLMLYAMAQRPFIAAGMWLWTALFFPNAWVYGFASVIRYNLLFAAVAIVAYLAYKHKPKIQLGGIGVLVLLFFVWTTISSATTIGNPVVVWEMWSRFSKVVMLFLFVLLAVKDKLHLDFMLWCVAWAGASPPPPPPPSKRSSTWPAPAATTSLGCPATCWATATSCRWPSS